MNLDEILKLSQNHFQKGEYDQAIEHFAEAHRIDPNLVQYEYVSDLVEFSYVV
ncbi:hypothetical protein JCM19233_1867 [Vibrio astriarenae]|nr:hypothetical protein JCM19233_1867 [Vibrio sp. C7]